MVVFEINTYASLREAVETVSTLLSERNAPSERVFDARLVMSELVGNVLRHAKTTAKLAVEFDGEFAQLCVYSDIPFLPPTVSRKADVFAENGRGLFLVDSVIEKRTCTQDGKVCVRIKISK